MRSIATAVGALRRSGIREMMDSAASLDGVLHLEIGEPDFPTPSHIVDAVVRALASGDVKYTLSRGTPELRALLAEKLRERNRIDVPPEAIVVTSGGTPAVYGALAALLDPGDGVLLPDPGWPSAEMAATLLGARPLHYRLTPESGYQPDLEQLEALAPQARLLVLNTPSNPTGAVFGRELLERLLGLAQRHDLTVLSDEVYEEIVFDADHVSIGSLGDPDRVVSVFSFSKSYAMTGWRVGYVVAPLEVAEAIVKVQEAIVACPSWPGQKAAEAALTGPQDAVAAMRAAYRTRRDVAVAALEREGLLLAVPQGAFYVMVDVSALSDDTYAIARTLLHGQRVAVAPGESFGPNGGGAVRLSLASSEEVVAEAIERIARAVRGADTVSASR
ncbi:MAG TPA: aminotransferase class I/II-fold pyridoxal phosphate-dependent enzyme [Gaiellaceae bacterium]|nr:aminotransferase class I/II-fold pyridoxal phosphate-dependent enzyme [Gaiellaceae bacterium]